MREAFKVQDNKKSCRCRVLTWHAALRLVAERLRR